MKKQFSLLLSLALMSSLASPALAAGAAPSQQTLRVDGSVYQCEQYNIDGSNYFKLRDLAFLLEGSGSEFAVGYDGAANTVSIATDRDFSAAGLELLLGADASASARRSPQTVLIDGKPVTGIDVYNIGGFNYFRLRDLADALGFDAGYDAASDSALVWSRPEAYLLTKYSAEEGSTAIAYTYTYTADGRPASQVYTYSEGGEVTDRSEITSTYDDAGHLAKRVCDYGSYSQTQTYDALGNMLSEVTTATDSAPETTRTFTYNAKGYREKEVLTAGAFTSTTVYTYDARSNVLSETTSDSDGGHRSYTYTYDAAGNCLSETYSGSDVDSSTLVTTFNALGQTLKSDYRSDDGSGNTVHEVTTYTYNAQNRLVKEERVTTERLFDETSTDGYTITRTYDAAGRELSRTTVNADGTSETTRYTYNASGDLATESYSSTNEGSIPWVDTYSYDAGGRLAKIVEKIGDAESTTVYSYDAHGNLIKLTDSDGSTVSWEYRALGAAQ